MTTTRIDHTNHTHPATAAARAACRRNPLMWVAVTDVINDPKGGAIRSRAKTNEYRAETLKVKGLPKCRRCDSYRFDAEVTGPDVDGLCGPTYCHHAVSNSTGPGLRRCR